MFDFVLLLLDYIFEAENERIVLLLYVVLLEKSLDFTISFHYFGL